MKSQTIILACLGVLGTVALTALLLTVSSTPSGKSPEQLAAERAALNPAPEAESEVNNASRLQIQALEKRIDNQQENLDKLFTNQEELKRAITELIARSERDVKTQKDNRAYIAMMYQKILDIELKSESVGGGMSSLSGNRKRTTTIEAEDPLPGMEELPGLLPPITQPKLEPSLPPSNVPVPQTPQQRKLPDP